MSGNVSKYNSSDMNRVRKQREKRRRKKRRRLFLKRVFIIIVSVLILLVIVSAVREHLGRLDNRIVAQGATDYTGEYDPDRPELKVDLLTISPYNRPGIALEQVNSIVIHYTGNIGTTAQSNRDYFEGLATSHETSASSHFVVGLEGEIVQCIPTAEKSYASNDRNDDTISIECCYENEDGSFNQSTYNSVIHLTAWLCKKFGLTGQDVIRHYDVTGKMCPLYYAEHQDAWEQFQADVDEYLEKIR